ncbi:uncharacterized protein IAS62_002720 [Cryptococcus decagattii]|uniref:alpha-galactosidase n=1 Tax=Cryptococcus decagattii TaxID=1859122 RepID=A0ABZ2ASD1_9TREE
MAATAAKPLPRNVHHEHCSLSSSVTMVGTSVDATSPEETASNIFFLNTETALASATSSNNVPTASLISTVTSVSLSSTFVYELDAQWVTSPEITTDTGLVVNAGVYIVNGEGTSEDTISDADKFDPACVCGPGSASCIFNVESIMSARISSFMAKDCDGVDPDNVDSFANSDQLHGNTADDQVNYLLWLSSTAHSQGLMIDLKNAGSLLADDNESCPEYEESNTYDSFLATGKPEIQIEYGDITTCPSLQDGPHLLVYNQNSLSSALVTLECD